MKQTKYLYTILTAVLIFNSGLAQTNTQRYIDVNGSAETEITPNIIKLTVTLTEYEKDRKLVLLNEIEKGFLEAVTGSKLPDDKIVVTRVASNAFNTRRKRKAFASKTYELTFSDQKGLLDFTSRLKNTDIDNLYISHLSHTKMAEYRLDVKKEALLAAKKKAQVLVEAVEAKLGPIMSITEGSSFDNPYMRQALSSNASVRYKQEADLVADDIGFKKLKLRFEINARFAIE